MSTALIRPARAQDKEAVLGFTTNTWDWGDYIGYAWDQWLAQPNAELSVAELDGAVVGLCMTSLASPTEGWLQGLRVHPDYRRLGLARQLTDYQLDLLRRWRVPVVRLAVHCRNVASQTHVAHMGFRRMTTFAPIRQATASLTDSDETAETVPAAEAEAMWAQLASSPTLRAAAGLWARGWTWLRLTREVIEEQVQQGQVVGVRGEGGRWAALAIAHNDDEEQHVGYVDGSGEALARLARALTGRARRAAVASSTVALPPVPEIVSAFRRAGYVPEEGGAGIYIYELPLR